MAKKFTFKIPRLIFFKDNKNARVFSGFNVFKSKPYRMCGTQRWINVLNIDQKQMRYKIPVIMF